MSSTGTTVKLKTKNLKSGKESLYLQYYNSDTGKRRKEYLGLYLIQKPRKQLDKEHNKEIRSLAESLLSKKIIEIQEGRFGFRSKELQEILFLPYFESLMEKKKTSSSNKNYSQWKSTLSHLRKFTRDDLRLSKVDPKFLNDLKEYLLKEKVARGGKTLSQNAAQSYFNNVLFTMKTAFNEGIILENPARKVQRIKYQETHREYLTEEEIQKLFVTECRHDRIKRFFLFGILTGLRFSDIENMEWHQVHFSEEQGWFVRFQQQKTKGSETLHITDQARELLGEPTQPEERVFKGMKYSANNNHILMMWVRDSGINKHITFHSARHTHAVLLLSKGVDIYTVSKILGHKEVKTTQIYAKVIDQNKIDAIKKIPKFEI
ncbi:MAG: site-specific integrase [Cyclobacteriaceae bacterium]